MGIFVVRQQHAGEGEGYNEKKGREICGFMIEMSAGYAESGESAKGTGSGSLRKERYVRAYVRTCNETW